MMSGSSDPPIYLDAYLAPLAGELERHDVTDIFINRPGEYWVETLDGALDQVSCPELNSAALARLSRQIAAVSGQGVGSSLPLLSGHLPDGTRVQIVAPSVARRGTAIAIRRNAAGRMSLDDFARVGAFDVADDGTGQKDRDRALRGLAQERDWPTFLRTAVRQRRNIVISGGTSSGKTTFLNALLQEIPVEERLILIEDTPELNAVQPNVVSLIASRGNQGEANVSVEDLLTASLRLRPDRILLGEIRGSEAFSFLRAVNTGHPGSMTTIHADTPDRAVEQLALLVLRGGSRLSRADVIAYVHSVADVQIQLDRHDGKRRVTEVRLAERIL